MPRYSLGGGGGTAAVTALNNATANELVTVGSTTTELDAETALTFDGSDMKLLEAVNDGNPSISIGGADAERLVIQAKFDSGAQTLESVEFATAAASGTADRGKMVFDVDGTDIMTIDDGGGITFAQDVTMTADKSLNLPQGANIKFTDAITQDSIDDDDHQGIIMTFTAGSTVTQYSPVYLGTDDEVHECDADAIATMPAIGVSINTSNVADGNPIEVMMLGLIRNEDFTDFGTNGAPVYVSTTVGTMSNTAPSGTDDVVQVIGHSVGEKLLFVQACLTTIEHA